MKFLFFVISLSVLLASNSEASLITFNLRNTAEGQTIEDNGSVTVGGVTLTVAVTPGFGQTGAEFNATADRAGINTDVAGDLTNEIEADASGNEELTFTVTFDSQSVASVDLTEIDFIGVGSANGGDAALVSLNSTLIATLETGVTGFSGSTDIWTPGSPISISSGAALSFGAEESIGLQSITFDVTPIPEPSTILFFSLFAAGAGVLGMRRRKRISESL